MKIGILTFHCAHNYGAVLQTYALVTYLRKNNYDAEIIDYKPKSLTMSHGIMPWRRISRLNIIRKVIFVLRILPFLTVRKERSDKFQSFIDSLPLSTRKYTETDSEVTGYDIIICGSDQVWNPSITNGFDKFFCGSVSHKGKFISYAASTEAKRIISDDYKKYKEVLSNFENISVRESELKNILQPLINKEITKVIDPVFLLSANEWQKVAIKPTFTDKPYLLVYQVKRDDRVLDMANKYAALHHMCVVEVTAEAEYKKMKNRILTASPFEFVGLFANASCVVTTSFHGTAFSIIFNKPFKTVLFNAPGDGRALDVMNTFGIENSTVNVDSGDIQEMSLNTPNLDIIVRTSETFIKQAIQR